MLNVKRFSDSILPLKDLHLVGPVEVHAKLLRWHFPDPANERTSEEHIQTNLNQCMNLSGLDQRYTTCHLHRLTLTQITKQIKLFYCFR